MTIKRLDHVSVVVDDLAAAIAFSPPSESRLAILPHTTHVTLMNRMTTIVPMVNDLLNAKPQKK